MAVVVVLVVGAVVIAASLIAWKVRSGKSTTGRQRRIYKNDHNIISLDM